MFREFFKLKEFADDNFKFDELSESSPKEWKTVWVKKKCCLNDEFCLL